MISYTEINILKLWCYLPTFFFAVLGLELRAYTLSHSTSPFFEMGFFEIRSCELFAQAGFKLQS
jgi:hypothetical protein